ncbi:MAG: hypothetical protein QOE79_275 [Sphingomonadales bacterium]|jgi:hypothetical protein|nr:hypothetical protein [Sphingomonadales bacterium]
MKPGWEKKVVVKKKSAEGIPAEDEGAPAEGFRRRRDGLTAAKRETLVAALARYGTLSDACRVVGISTHTFYRHEKRDPEFAARCKAAKREASGKLEALAWERATVGADETLIRDGAVVQVRRKPSDAMLRLLMQASEPERYGGTMGRRVDRKALRAEIEAELRPKIEAELRAKGWRPKPTRAEAHAFRREFSELLSEYNRRMSAHG